MDCQYRLTLHTVLSVCGVVRHVMGTYSGYEGAAKEADNLAWSLWGQGGYSVEAPTLGAVLPLLEKGEVADVACWTRVGRTASAARLILSCCPGKAAR